jgi:hypothetical protein
MVSMEPAHFEIVAAIVGEAVIEVVTGDAAMRFGEDVDEAHLHRVIRAVRSAYPIRRQGSPSQLSGRPSMGPDTLLSLVQDASSDSFHGALYVFQVKRADRGVSVCLNSFGRFVMWVSASIMPPPSLVPAR